MQDGSARGPWFLVSDSHALGWETCTHARTSAREERPGAVILGRVALGVQPAVRAEVFADLVLEGDSLCAGSQKPLALCGLRTSICR